MGRTAVSMRNDLAKRRRWRKQGRCWQCGELKEQPEVSMCNVCGIKNRERAIERQKSKGLGRIVQPGKRVYR